MTVLQLLNICNTSNYVILDDYTKKDYTDNKHIYGNAVKYVVYTYKNSEKKAFIYI